MNTPPLARTKPSTQYWLGLLFIPVATFIFTAMALGLYGRLMKDAVISRNDVLMAWVIITIVVILWCILRDPHVLTWTLTETEPRRGKNQDDLVIPFADIESIVLGLPPRLPWFFRITRFDPHGHGMYDKLVLLRRTAFLLRLRGGRMMPLNFMTFQYQNGRTFMEAFLRLNTAKIVGPESYTQAEMRKLGVAGLNRMVRV